MKSRVGGDDMDYAVLAQEMSRAHCAHLREIGRVADFLQHQGEDGVLLCLRLEDKPILSGELMEKMGLTTGRVANILKHMEEKGLVCRWQDHVDRRRVFVSLTDDGRALAQVKYDQVVSSHLQILKALGGDSDQTIQAVWRFVSAVNQIH